MSKPTTEADALVEAAVYLTRQITDLLRGLEVLDTNLAIGVRQYVSSAVYKRPGAVREVA